MILAACSARPAPSLNPSASARTSAQPSQSPSPHASPSAEPSEAAPSATPALDSRTPVFLIVFENKGASQIVNNPDAPYLNTIGAEYGYALNYYGVRLSLAAELPGGVIFVTFDEDSGGDGNNVSTIVVSEATRGGVVSDRAYSHYTLLRTVQELLGLPCLAESCDAQPMSDLVGGPGSN